MSLGRFEYIEPPRITVTKGKAGLQGRLGEFGVVRPQQTSSNHCDVGGTKAYREGSVGAVRPLRTSSNHCDVGGRRPTGKV